MEMLVRYKELIKELGYTGKDICGLMGGMTYASYRSMTRGGGRYVPKWVRGFMLGYMLGLERCEKKSDPSGVGVKGKE